MTGDNVEFKGNLIGFTVIHSLLDDAGLDPYEFRVYCRIIRRAGSNGTGCYESQEKIAQGCGMSRRQVIRCFKTLTERGFIMVQKKENSHLTVWPLPPVNWVTPVTESHTPCDSESHPPVTESHTKESLKKESKEGTNTYEDSQEKKESKDDLLSSCLLRWKAAKRPEWVNHSVFSSRAKGQIRRLAEWAKADGRLTPLDAFGAALSWASTREEWLRGRAGTTLDEIGANEKLIQYAEKFMANARTSESNARQPEPAFPPGTKALLDNYHEVEVLMRDDGRLKVRYPSGAVGWAYDSQLEVME